MGVFLPTEHVFSPAGYIAEMQAMTQFTCESLLLQEKEPHAELAGNATLTSTLLSSPRETISAWKWQRGIGCFPWSCLPWENAACSYPSPPPGDQSASEPPLDHLRVQSPGGDGQLSSPCIQIAACELEPRIKLIGLGVCCQQQGKSTSFFAGARTLCCLP